MTKGFQTPTQKPTVLIVDDEKDMRFVLQDLLNYWGYQTITASHGNEALEILKKETPLVVLSDLNMPGLDGLQLLQIIKQQYPKLPVIIMSGRGTAEEQAKKILECGAFDFLPKPFDLDYLKQVLSAVQVLSPPSS